MFWSRVFQVSPAKAPHLLYSRWNICNWWIYDFLGLSETWGKASSWSILSIAMLTGLGNSCSWRRRFAISRRLLQVELPQERAPQDWAFWIERKRWTGGLHAHRSNVCSFFSDNKNLTDSRKNSKTASKQEPSRKGNAYLKLQREESRMGQRPIHTLSTWPTPIDATIRCVVWNTCLELAP